MEKFAESYLQKGFASEYSVSFEWPKSNRYKGIHCRTRGLAPTQSFLLGCIYGFDERYLSEAKFSASTRGMAFNFRDYGSNLETSIETPITPEFCDEMVSFFQDAKDRWIRQRAETIVNELLNKEFLSYEEIQHILAKDVGRTYCLGKFSHNYVLTFLVTNRMAKEYLVRTKAEKRTQTLYTLYENPNLPDGEILEQPREGQLREVRQDHKQEIVEEVNQEEVSEVSEDNASEEREVKVSRSGMKNKQDPK